MNTSNRHPDTELLDRLRAGLLDNAPERKSGLEAHLAQCASCRARLERLGQLRADGLSPPDLEDRLNRARERALNMPQRFRLPRFALPLAAAAAVALFAVVLIEPVQEATQPETRVADTGVREVPELYEELDFYLWLADHKATTGDSAS